MRDTQPTLSNLDEGPRLIRVAKTLAEWRVLDWVAQSRGTMCFIDRPAPDAIAHADIN